MLDTIIVRWKHARINPCSFISEKKINKFVSEQLDEWISLVLKWG